ncbi:MAG TPA: type II secretion system protein GspM [Nitrospiria bacterium]|jgi:type II secretory pathway component PulM
MKILFGAFKKALGVDLFKKLSHRERIFTVSGGITLVFLFVYFFGVSPLLEQMKTVDRLILQKEDELQKMAFLKKEFDELKGKLRGIEQKISQQKKDFSLLSFLEGTANTVEIRKNISSMRPQPIASEDNSFEEDSVEVRVENVKLSQIVEFLTAIESSPVYLRVKQVRLKTRYSDPNFMDATFLISSYQKKFT